MLMKILVDEMHEGLVDDDGGWYLVKTDYEQL